ncbi:Crp/Fnr family transcriptional regulator [Dyadobacter frigoris]|uniref:Crp/Fnr family transcriptional regulator n=1 Tax=Dyadobacter frigoris TaxID=2576211 RepID=A0A4U6CZN1_9BACT|nr:Crp/Fnr family transcriptional regulator [Dyadobacter frigoris]TKT89375.1 Crp/Fnr family transcriptional regulator [Dyadobacter frigoris]GLU55486.1 cAMP-binding protein [Dyadobacter frigoris]
MEEFFQEIERYHALSEACKNEFASLLKTRFISKNNFLLRAGEIPVSYAFVSKGLFSYYFTSENGDIVIKKFFAEKSLIASTSALIENRPGHFSICALEDSTVLTYNDQQYRSLMHKYPELAFFHIAYLEKNWVVKKEHLEISLKYETAAARYQKFHQEYQQIESRLKLHQIASYLGITPTQLSRIRKTM